MPEETEMLTVRLPKDLFHRLAKRLPKRGDRSILLRTLLKDFLDGKISVVIPAHKF